MSDIVISGIQQMGIGVKNMPEAWKWYRENFGVDICIFEERAAANFMLPYTGGVPKQRHAALVINLQSGGGFEVWQYTDRTPQAPTFDITAGDLGIFITKVKCKDIAKTHQLFSERNHQLSPIVHDPSGAQHFFVKDPYGNIFQLVDANTWFRNENKLTGGVYGAVIGVTNIEKAKSLYCDILGFDEIVFDVQGIQNDYAWLPGGNNSFRRVLLKNSKPRKGPFSHLFMDSYIELIQVKDRTPKKMFEGRFWGDLGFIHLCFDIQGMNHLKKLCTDKGFPFTVDSKDSLKGNIFDMGEAAGHFSYIEDPDGTLIEFVETHKVPVLKKLGWYINLKKRNPEKALPDWMLKAMRFNRYKE